jgi:hypothetical protein
LTLKVEYKYTIPNSDHKTVVGMSEVNKLFPIIPYVMVKRASGFEYHLGIRKLVTYRLCIGKQILGAIKYILQDKRSPFINIFTVLICSEYVGGRTKFYSTKFYVHIRTSYLNA